MISFPAILSWVLLWVIALIFFFMSLFACRLYFSNAKSGRNGSDLQVLIPYGLVAFVILCSPLYLESYFASKEYIFDQNGNYLYTVKPNRYGIMLQRDWDAHHKGERKGLDSLDLMFSHAHNSVIVYDPTNSAVFVQIVFTGYNEKEYHLKRGTFAIKKGIEPRYLIGYSGTIVSSIVSEMVSCDTPLQDNLIGTVRSFNLKRAPEEALTTKSALIKNVLPLNEKLKEYGLYVTEVMMR